MTNKELTQDFFLAYHLYMKYSEIKKLSEEEKMFLIRSYIQEKKKKISGLKAS